MGYTTTSNVLAWTSHTAKLEPSIEEEAGDADEPPDFYATTSPLSDQFRRTSLRRGSEHHESLLTKALQSHSEDDQSETTSVVNRRRRSMTSNTSFASTTDITCDTGFTTPARTSTPSPRLPDGPFSHNGHATKARLSGMKDPAVQALEKKRCISFACAAKPKTDAKPPPPKPTVTVSKPAEQAPPRRSCIRFACPTRPAKCTPPEHVETIATTPVAVPSSRKESQSPAVKHRSPSTFRLARPLALRRSSKSPVAVRTTSKKWLTADSKDLESECSRFHAFASDEVEEDDWIRRDQKSGSGRITIDDTLQKENAIRKLGEEVEEEEELEEQLEDEADNEDGDDAGDDNEDEGDDDVDIDEDRDQAELEDDQSVDGSDADGGSDGYNTDNEVGFAESEEDDDDLDLWTTGLVTHLSLSGATPVRRRSSFAGEVHSDSSVYNQNKRRTRAKRVPRADTPELPDSTDFVCGTLDEDKPLEEAYVSRMVARRKEKLHPIPQDIDPSFPTSEPEDEAEELYNHGHHGSDDQVFGDMEDVSDGVARKDRHHKNVSPKRYHSPPPKRHHSPAPKRHHSPAPKVRGRSPRRLFDGLSPRRVRSPPPQVSRSPAASPVLAGQGIGFKPLASRPGLVFTKSLPRTPAVFGPAKARRGRSGTITQENHIRGAIDIVKGLEQKRQRRKEKFYQKYCTRARKNPAQTKRPAPGQGAQRMREVGLTMAGKMGQSNFVLSV
ncbi:hypothetical protein CONLIGDRAFT_570734 [Coniochaeta ligniaria NRRL 30616]|uniref:Uncharacterized protein n=1 Tax=Coniochaeta ligniaria NRRL 30616 TaxID=1408157 RepID=A0A1J7J1R6_9PEZI|nr:hypothetical protein CONLIGDRAFT_570734 [Coniochaeta ligniaria NRRL 30616]